MFDFSFTHFVGPKIIKVVYVLVVVFTGLGYLGSTVISFAANAGFGLLVLIFGGLGAVLYLALYRMVLEFFLSVFRMSQDLHAIRSRSGV